ncbi:MAG: M48 family metalloprotease, partial [Pirellulales bacterium]|nr:M48 family metalloprotease [Pirellulales bacterium]
MNILELPDASLCVRLAATMGHFLWQGAAVYLLVIFAGLLLRLSSAGARYAVFTAALLVMAVCPPVTFVLLRSPEGPATTVGGQSPLYVRSEVETPAAFVGGQSPPYLGGDSPASPAGSRLQAAPTAAEPVSLAVPPEPAVEAIDWWRYAPWLVACYLGGTTLMFARLLVALCGGQRLRRRSEPVDDSAILAAFARQARALGLRFTPAIAFCREVGVPTVVGVLRPMVLLPLSAVSGLTTEQIEVLLAHELAHIRRYDHVVNILQRLIEAALFFHPAVWFISRRIRIEREHCCDDLVLAVGGQRFAYAESLVRMAELSRGSQRSPYGTAAAALGAVDRPSQLRLRILRLVSGNTGEQVRLLRPAVLGLCLFLMLAAVACVQLASRPTEDRPIEAVPPGMVGTWFFENPMGDDEQMAVFPDGRIVVLYSNGHRDETRYADGAIDLAEYGNLKARLMLLPDGRTLQTGTGHSGIAKLWQRIDAAPKTELLRLLIEAPAATQPTTHPADALAWGEAVDGLQVAVELVPAKEAYAYGEKIDVRFRVRNVGDRTIQLATATLRQDRAEIRDEGGTIREVPSKWYSGWAIIVRHELEPGQEVTLESTGLGIVQESQELESPWRQTGVRLKGKPGRYAIRYLLPFPDVRRERPDGTVSVPQPTDWQGTLNTGWRELTVKLPDDVAERRAAAAEAVRLPDDLTWAFDPTPGLEIGVHESRLRFRLGTKTLDLDVVDGKVRAAWSDGAKQNEVVGKVVRIDRPASGDSGASTREPVLIDVVDGKPLTNDAASPLLDAARPSFVKGKLRFRSWGSASHLIDTHEGKLRIWEPDRRRMIESQGLRYGGSPPAPSTAPAARPDTRPAPGGDVGGRSGDLPYATVSLGQPEAPGGESRAWYVLRQLNCGPLLREMPLQFAKASDPAVEASVLREDFPGGVPLEIDVRLEDGAAGEILVGLFTDEKWSQAPVRVLKANGAGRYTITGVPPGKYQVGAMIGDVLKPKALGVHKSWPQPVEVTEGKSNVVETLVSPRFERALGQSYRQIAEACQPGRTVASPDSPVRGRVTDSSGKPVAHVIVQIRQHGLSPGPMPMLMMFDTATDDQGHYFLDKKVGRFTIGVLCQESLPAILGSRSQWVRASGIRQGKAEINFDLKPFPRGSATLSGRCADQDGKPVQGLLVILEQDVEIDEEEQSQRTYSYRVPCWASDGRFALTDLPPGKHRMRWIPLDHESYEFDPAGSVDVEMKEGQASDVAILIRRKEALYGRVLMEDGSVPPAAVKPSWPGALMISSSDNDGAMISLVGQVDSDGYVMVRLAKKDREALDSGEAVLSINYPNPGVEKERVNWKRVGVFPFEELSADRAKAGVVKIRYADLPEPKPDKEKRLTPATQPVPGSDLSAKHTIGSSGTAPRTREQEFEERARALRAEVEAETPEETVRNLSYKTYEIISSTRSLQSLFATHGEEAIDDINKDPRVQKLLRLIHEGDDAQRRALRDAVLKMVNIYLTELPDSTPANAA